MDKEQPGRDHERMAEQAESREIGATAGRTHAEVLDTTIGPERRARNEAAAETEPGDEAGG